MTPAEAKLRTARADLLFTQPFWAYLALKLTLVPDETCETAWTDGASIGYNPKYIESLTMAQVKGLLAHETSHCAFGHCWRRGERDAEDWNVAADAVINQDLLASGFELPPGAVMRTDAKGLSAEAVYQTIHAERQKQPQQRHDEHPSTPKGAADRKGAEVPTPGANGQGKPKSDPGMCGEVRDGKAKAEAGKDGKPDESTTQSGWKEAVIQAARIARGKGNMPAGAGRAVIQAKEPECGDIVEAMMAWASSRRPDDYSWRRPNPRYIAAGLYMPVLETPGLGRIAVGIDTSGSITQAQLSEFVAALQRVTDDLQPDAVTVIACDTAVHATREYAPGEPISKDKTDYPGGGGTDFRPIFDAIEGSEAPVVGAVIFTDLLGRFPDREPDVPTLWVIRDPMTRRARPPFGDAVYLAA